MEYLLFNSHAYLNDDNIKRLNNAGIFTVIDFLNYESKEIEKITFLTQKEVLDMRKCLIKKYSHPRNGYDYYRRILSDSAIIPTGISRLDDMLDGGLFTGNIYEICGLPASGKTLFCLTLLKNIAPKQKGEIAYLDTKCDFYGSKLKDMMSDLNKEELVAAMNRVTVRRINSKPDFLNVLFEIKNAVENRRLIKCLIIDSLPSLVFSSRDQIERNAFLNYTANILHYFAKEYNIIIIITNLITLWNDGDFKNMDVMKEKISCGSFWYNVPNVRIMIKRNKSNCKMRLVKTIKFLPEINFCEIEINDKGYF